MARNITRNFKVSSKVEYKSIESTKTHFSASLLLYRPSHIFFYIFTISISFIYFFIFASFFSRTFSFAFFLIPSPLLPSSGRGACLNIIPSSTGAAKAIAKVLPSVSGKINGMAFRVPCADVSAIDLNVKVSREVTFEELKDCFKKVWLRWFGVALLAGKLNNS